MVNRNRLTLATFDDIPARGAVSDGVHRHMLTSGFLGCFKRRTANIRCTVRKEHDRRWWLLSGMFRIVRNQFESVEGGINPLADRGRWQHLEVRDRSRYGGTIGRGGYHDLSRCCELHQGDIEPWRQIPQEILRSSLSSGKSRGFNVRRHH